MKTKLRCKVLAILMSIAMAFAMMPIMATEAHAYTSITVGELTYILDEGSATLVSCTDNNLIDVIIPATVSDPNDPDGTTYTVTRIGSGAFNGCGNLTTVEIPKSVTSIGMSAFKDTGLTSVTFEAESSLTSIEDFAFENCGALATIEIPKSVTTIGGNAFKNTGLTSVTFESGSSLTSIGASAFEECGSLTTITIPKSVTTIGGNAFGNTGLTSVTFESGSSLTSIGASAFEECGSLTTITIPKSVTTISSNAFKNTGLTSVTFEAGSSLTSISSAAFENCSSLTTIAIPKSVKSIDGSAFKNSGLTSVTFEAGSSLTSIGGSAFENCGALATIEIPKGVTTIGGNAFGNTGLTSVRFEAGSSLDTIGFAAFAKCGSLTSVTIPQGVTTIGYNAFGSCNSLNTVYYQGTETQWNEMTGRESYWAGGRDVKVVFLIEAPKGLTLKYNGKEQTGVPEGEGYTLSGTTSAKEVGSYQATATLDESYEWSDGTTAPKTIDWKINNVTIEAPKGLTLKYNGKAQTGVQKGEGYTLSGAVSATNAGSYQATATLDEHYEWSDGTTAPKTISWKINKATAKVTAPAGKTFTYNGKAQTGVAAGSKYTLSGTVKATKAGSYTAKAALKANANYTYTWSDGTTAVKAIKWKINKAANTLTVKGKTTKVKYKKLKKKAQKLDVTNVISFTKAGQGAKTYKLVSVKKGKKNFDKKISIDSKTGKVTIKKKLKKGTYNVKVNVKAGGNVNYKASAWKAVTFKIKVK